MADESFDSIHWSMAMNGSSHDEGELTDDSETWIDSSSTDEESSSSYDEDDPRWVSRTIVNIRPARTIENQRITIGDLQRVLDILRGEELEVRFAAKLGINVTIVTSTDKHQRRLPFQQVEETSGGAAPLSTGEIKVFLSDMRKDVFQIHILMIAWVFCTPTIKPWYYAFATFAQALKRTVFDGDDGEGEEKNCPICLESFATGDQVHIQHIRSLP